jgi:flagellar biosynthesis regulator FlbT
MMRFLRTGTILYLMKMTLSFMGKEILISKKEESDPHKLIRTLFKDMSKVWANDEILEDWNYSLSDEDVTKNKAYQAGKAINRTIAQETTVKDFLSITTKSISINNKYLKPYKSL